PGVGRDLVLPAVAVVALDRDGVLADGGDLAVLDGDRHVAAVARGHDELAAQGAPPVSLAGGRVGRGLAARGRGGGGRGRRGGERGRPGDARAGGHDERGGGGDQQGPGDASPG